MSEQAIDEAALGEWLEANVEGFSGPFELGKFPSGQSNPTYRISAASGDYVLRRKPFGQLLPSAHAVDREYRLISALHPLDFPVPRPFALCSDPEVIGAIFYVMEMAHGRPYADGALPDFDPATRRRMYEQLVDTLADLHNIDPAAAELGDFGKPGNYFERQVMRWTRQYRDSQTDYVPEMERLIAFLPETLPQQSRTSIVHGDYRIDNALFDGDGTLTAVLDWELSTLGDPLADFSYLAMQWMMPADGGAGLAGLDLPALGIPSLEEVVERYSARSGVPVAGQLDWYFAYNLFRLAGIVQGIKKRVIDGTASHAQAAEMAKRVPMLAGAAWGFAVKAGA
ncbi:phosphotransferase family protein [Sphingomonas lutea]|uniref:Phosphotransferase family protein n=1 Tax=Sphingomonas lutea TaxID=1045317 RepID=A0A7G9SGL3_9SPHN|nr:phosphotransferase family protein [Sphingomonas lutea]QNN66988.1 phosphotransferase family protein [Sphingomonas lutea]